ncbi:hypothetical protein ACF0H5_023397 [Mactra antiquata]
MRLTDLLYENDNMTLYSMSQVNVNKLYSINHTGSTLNTKFQSNIFLIQPETIPSHRQCDIKVTKLKAHHFLYTYTLLHSPPAPSLPLCLSVSLSLSQSKPHKQNACTCIQDTTLHRHILLLRLNNTSKIYTNKNINA